jgi:hypothetical protein
MRREPDTLKSESHVWKSIMQASSIGRTCDTHDLSHKNNTSDIMLPREIKFEENISFPS